MANTLKITRDDLEQLLAVDHEVCAFEVKGPGSIGVKEYLAGVARAVMAMGNLRDGGVVCLGIDNKKMGQMLPGLEPNLVAEWTNFDDVSAELAPYSDPPVTFSSAALELSNGAWVVVLEVATFESIPHVCKRPYQHKLQQGATYVRPVGKPESVPVPSSVEMRELLDLATDRGVREFIRRAAAAGLLSTTQVSGSAEHDSQRFADEASSAWAEPSPIAEQINDHGRTAVSVQPTPFVQNRVPDERLESFIASQVVRMRGWPVPYMDSRRPTLQADGAIGQDIEPLMVPHLEAWRVCTSGQFLHRRVLATDLRSGPEFATTSEEASGTVVVWDVLLYMVEIAELGARLATALDAPSIRFDVALEGIAGRELVSGDWRRDLHGDYVVQADRLSQTLSIESTTLLGDPRGFGVTLAQGLLRKFGLAVSDGTLREWQDEVFSR